MELPKRESDGEKNVHRPAINYEPPIRADAGSPEIHAIRGPLTAIYFEALLAALAAFAARSFKYSSSHV